MIIFIIRHAQSEHNITNNCNILDPSITEFGKQQALSVRGTIPDYDIILCSPSQRTLQTSSIIFNNEKMYATDLLSECNTGVPCNCRKDLETQKAQFPHVDIETYKVDPIPREITFDDIQKRCHLIKEFLKTLPYQKIVLVSHAHLIKSLVYCITGKFDHVDLPNCGILKINFNF